MTKIALTIAGVDPSGGAGVYADVRAIAAFGVFPTAAITSITFQNTQGVFGAEHQTAESVRRQVEPILEDYTVDAVKTGMLPNREIIDEIARLVEAGGLRNFVVDPVVRCERDRIHVHRFDRSDDREMRNCVRIVLPCRIPARKHYRKVVTISFCIYKFTHGVVEVVTMLQNGEVILVDIEITVKAGSLLNCLCGICLVFGIFNNIYLVSIKQCGAMHGYMETFKILRVENCPF